jgi:hypothetical protein
MKADALVIGAVLALYGAIGLVLGLAFVFCGVTRMQPLRVTTGARILLLPAAVALWPFVLIRWLKSPKPQ